MSSYGDIPDYRQERYDLRRELNRAELMAKSYQELYEAARVHLRDTFAGQALVALAPHVGDTNALEKACKAYQIADAMLAARDAKKDRQDE